MIYVTGGGAWASLDFNAGGPANDFVFSSTSTKSGWTIGAGYEWLINPNWSVRAEYLYYKFTGATSATVNAGGVAPAGTFTTHSIGRRSPHSRWSFIFMARDTSAPASVSRTASLEQREIGADVQSCLWPTTRSFGFHLSNVLAHSSRVFCCGSHACFT